MDKEIIEGFVQTFRDRGNLATCIRTGLMLLADKPTAFDAFVRQLSVAHPDLASQIAWTLADVHSVRLRGGNAA